MWCFFCFTPFTAYVNYGFSPSVLRDIPEQFRSHLNWDSATFELAGIERNPTPSMKIYALLQCAKAVYAEFKNEVLPSILALNPHKTDVAIGADDFLPIFLYILCQSSINTPLLTKELLWGLCHPDQLYGESGYYLTVYESALEFVQNIEVDDEALRSVDDDEFDEDRGRRTLSAAPGDMEEMLSPAAQIKKKLRRMSVNVIERVTPSKSNSLEVDSFGHRSRSVSQRASASTLLRDKEDTNKNNSSSDIP